MPDSATPVDLRKSPRARLCLPARLRWFGPMGMRVEITETIDVSREGLLIRRAERCNPMARMWVVYPFNDSSATIQPETPARVARIHVGADGGFYVGLQLELPLRDSPRAADDERRKSERFCFALPMFVRPSGSRWPEESMTQNISNAGVRFESARTYTPGETVLAKIPWGDWAKAGEIPGRVVRVDAPPENTNDTGNAGPSPTLTSVAIEWIKTAERNGNANGAKASKVTSP
jgi:hypothetical protein